MKIPLECIDNTVLIILRTFALHCLVVDLHAFNAIPLVFEQYSVYCTELHITKRYSIISTYLLLGTGLIPIPSYSLYDEVVFQKFCHFQIVQSGKSYNSEQSRHVKELSLLDAYFLPVKI